MPKQPPNRHAIVPRLVQGLETEQDSDNPARALTLLSDGRLASAHANAAVRLWDMELGRVTATLEGHTGEVLALDAFDDGRLASAGADGTLRIWDPGTTEQLNVVKAGTPEIGVHWKQGYYASCSPVAHIAASADDTVATASSDNGIRVWEPRGWKPLRILDGHRDQITGLQMIGGNKLASASLDRTIRVWNLETGEGESIVDIDRFNGNGNVVLCGASGIAVVGKDDDSILVINIVQQEEICTLSRHGKTLENACLLTRDRAVTYGHQEGLCVWDMNSGRELSEYKIDEPDVATSMIAINGSILAIGSIYFGIQILDVGD